MTRACGVTLLVRICDVTCQSVWNDPFMWERVKQVTQYSMPFVIASFLFVTWRYSRAWHNLFLCVPRLVYLWTGVRRQQISNALRRETPAIYAYPMDVRGSASTRQTAVGSQGNRPVGAAASWVSGADCRRRTHTWSSQPWPRCPSFSWYSYMGVCA